MNWHFLKAIATGLVIISWSGAYSQQPSPCESWSDDVTIQQKYDAWTFKRNSFYELIVEFKKAVDEQLIAPEKIQRAKYYYDSLVVRVNETIAKMAETTTGDSIFLVQKEAVGGFMETIGKLYESMVAYKNSLLINKTSENGIGESLKSLFLRFVVSSSVLKGDSNKLNCLKWSLWDAIHG